MFTQSFDELSIKTNGNKLINNNFFLTKGNNKN